MFFQAFYHYWQSHFSDLEQTSCAIVAVSGGVDSIVLADLLASLELPFVIAHCNFHLRAAESDRDQHFVEAFAGQLGRACLVKDFETTAYAAKHKIGIEEAARDLRYAWFRQLAEQYGEAHTPAPIFVAHHASDNVETVLMNFSKGCGIAGLHGILPINQCIYRPLLFATRNEIQRYALSKGLQWVEDSTNRDVHYLRNFFRNDIIPSLKERIPTLESNIVDNIQRFREVETIYQAYFSRLSASLFSPKNGMTTISIESLKSLPAIHTSVYELFSSYGFTARQTAELIKLLDSDSGSVIRSTSHEVFKDREVLMIRSLNEVVENSVIAIEEHINKTIISDNEKLVLVDSLTGEIGTKQVVLDANKLVYPLQLRHWQSGDEFYPTGMTGKKKLAKYFKDLKIPVPEKSKIWILTSAGQIVWILGYRADRRFMANASSISTLTYIFDTH